MNTASTESMDKLTKHLFLQNFLETATHIVTADGNIELDDHLRHLIKDTCYDYLFENLQLLEPKTLDE